MEYMAVDGLTQRVGGVYYLKNGQQRDPFGLQDFHPASNVNRLEIYLEDGVSTNLVMVNFKADQKGYPASEWFPTIYNGTVPHVVNGESVARTFAKYWLLLPPQVLQWNANGSSALNLAGTVVQSAGDSLLGAYQNVSALELNEPASEELYDSNAVAYCYETEGENLYGFYMITYDGGEDTYAWALIDNPITQINMVQTKQYNIVGMQIQKGNLPRPTSTVTISDEYIRYILAYLAQVNGLAHQNEIDIEALELSIAQNVQALTDLLVTATENDWNFEGELPSNVRFGNSRNGWIQIGSDVYIFGGT